MEKYSRWSDLSTGINPFVPQQTRLHNNIAIKALQLLGGTALAIVRAPLVLVLGAVLAVTNVITSVLAIVPFFGRLLQRLTEWLLCSLLLLTLGVFVSEEAANARRLGLAAPGAKATTKGAVHAKDVLVCNHTSFLEVLYLAKRFSPVFVFVCSGNDDNNASASKGLVHVCGLLEAIYRSLAAPIAANRTTTRKLADVVANASGPVVIFPEGARSNGKSVLAFAPVLETLPLTLSSPKQAPLRIHLVAFRFATNASFSPSQSAGSSWSHVFWTAFHGYHSLHVTLLHANALALSATSTTGALNNAQVERLRTLLAAMLRTKPVALTAADAQSFQAYWSHVRSGGKKPAAAFTNRKAPHEHAQWSHKTQ